MAGIHIALLHSIGIGDGRRLIMADWRSMMEDIGLQNPRTLISTSNAIQVKRNGFHQLPGPRSVYARILTRAKAWGFMRFIEVMKQD